MVERYDIEYIYEEAGSMGTASDGDYVLYEDYEKLKKRLDACHDKLHDLYLELFPETKIA